MNAPNGPVNGTRFTVHAATAIASIALIAVAGCRTSAQKKYVPRVDLELGASGNRGYLVGTPPPVTHQKVTREMLDITLELPAFGKALGSAPPPPSSLDAVHVRTAAPEPSEAPAAGGLDAYTVQRGDSLWSIAAKPEMYGNATQWRVLFDANRDQLASPNALKAGMVLKIPRGDAVAEASDEERGYRK